MPSSSTAPSRSATHPLNVSYLVLGLVFLGIAAMWALHAAGAIDSGDVGLLLPLTLVAAGAVGLVAFAARGVSRSRQLRSEAVDDGAESWDDDPDGLG